MRDGPGNLQLGPSALSACSDARTSLTIGRCIRAYRPRGARNENRWGSIGMPGCVTRMNSLALLCRLLPVASLKMGQGSSNSTRPTPGCTRQPNCRTGSGGYRSGTHPPPAEIRSPVPERRTRRKRPRRVSELRPAGGCTFLFHVKHSDAGSV